VNCFILENGNTPVAAPLKLAFENHKHPVRRIALTDIGFAGLDVRLLRLRKKPGDLLLRQIGERWNAK